MRCYECGATLTTDARFCSRCGARTQTLRDVSDPLREALEKAIGFQYRIERLLGRDLFLKRILELRGVRYQYVRTEAKRAIMMAGMACELLGGFEQA